MQDIECRIVIAIKHNPTARTDMCPNTEQLLDDGATVGTFLGGPMRRDCNHRNVVQECVAVDPLEEDPPSCIMDRLGKLAVTDHIPDLKVLIGNPVARRDIRVCLLSGKILTLPLNFQMLRSQPFLGLLPISRFLLRASEASLQTFELVFSFSVVSGVLNCSTFRIGQVRFESDIDSQLFPSWDMLDFPLGLDAKLHVVAKGTPIHPRR